MLNRESLTRQSSKAFLDESKVELLPKTQPPKRGLCGCILRSICVMNVVLVGLLIFKPSCDLDVYWDKTILDIETYSVTRTVTVDVTNLNWFGNKLKKLDVDEYVRTCPDCQWQLVEQYSQTGDLEIGAYDSERVSLESTHPGINVEEALDISKACMDETLSIKFRSSWVYGGVFYTHQQDVEQVFCETQEPYELALTSYHTQRERDLYVDFGILEVDRIEQMRHNVANSHSTIEEPATQANKQNLRH